MKARRQAQLSLEFLIVLAAFSTALLLLLPAALSAWHSALFALDSRNAESLAVSLEHSVREFSVLSEGSRKELHFSPIGKWVFSGKESRLEITVHGTGKSRTLCLEMPQGAEAKTAREEIEGNAFIVIEKKHGVVEVELFHENG